MKIIGIGGPDIIFLALKNLTEEQAKHEETQLNLISDTSYCVYKVVDDNFPVYENLKFFIDFYVENKDKLNEKETN